MVKVRSKLKRNVKGKEWKKGFSCVSNPENMKHRLKAKSRFFQANLSLAPPDVTSKLTLSAVMKHEQRQLFDAETTTINDVAGSLKSFKLNDDDSDETMSESQQESCNTFKTFASNFSQCSNMSFKKLMIGFRPSSELHKKMLAVLSALTEIIKERGGTESSTEYFILLMEQIDAAKDQEAMVAGISLLAMGIKSVPAPVLRKKFDRTASILLRCLQAVMETTNQTVLKSTIGCLSVLLRMQDYTTWTYSSTWQYIDAILAFTTHSKPKIRKAAQHAVASIIHGSLFMLPQKSAEDSDSTTSTPGDYTAKPRAKFHPAGERVTRFCLNQFKPEVLANSQTTVLHTLKLLKDTIAGFKTEDIRSISENLLSIMTAANVLVRTNCFQTLHSLFQSRTPNLSSVLCAKLLAALHEYRPDRLDQRQTLAWLAVIQEGHMHLAGQDLNLCINALPHLMDICANDLWLSDHSDTITNTATCIKELLLECVKPACATSELAERYRVPVGKIIALLCNALDAPFGAATKFIILTFAHVFEACGEYFSCELAAPLNTLAQRYDTESSLRVQLEHSIITAIKAIGPEHVLKVIPIANATGDFVLERSWLLPLVREGTVGASFRYFHDAILSLAQKCNAKWSEFAQENAKSSNAITYELLCGQLWGLFPGFCRSPKDPENYCLIAPTVCRTMKSNPEFRAPIYDGLMELLSNEEQARMQAIMAQYAKNYLPSLFDIYTQRPIGTYETELRNKCLEVIKLYIAKAPAPVLQDIFVVARKQLKSLAPGSFEYDALFDIASALMPYQNSEFIRLFFEKIIVPVLMNEKSKIVSKDEQKLKKQQRKCYELLRDILSSEVKACQQFTNRNLAAIQQLLLEAFKSSCAVCQATRLRCLKLLLVQQQPENGINAVIVQKCIPEAVLQFKEFSTRKENISEELIQVIGNIYQEAGKTNDFVDVLIVGFTGNEMLITNTILALRCLIQHFGKNLTVSTLEFVWEQIAVFLVQKSRPNAEAAIAFLITLIKVMPVPLLVNHLEMIMKSLSAMAKDTKRHCRLQIGYLLKKLVKRFTAEELIKFVPGDDELTHKRLKKIRKQLRRETRKKLNDEKNKEAEDNDSAEEFVGGSLEKKSMTIDDILADSDSDLPQDMEADEEGPSCSKRRGRARREQPDIYIREDPDEIVDFTDLKSIANVLTTRPELHQKQAHSREGKPKDNNRGFKTTPDGRLIISDKALRGMKDSDDDGTSSSADESEGEAKLQTKKRIKRGMEEDSSDAESEKLAAPNRKRKQTDLQSMRSGKTSASRYTAGGKGIHRNTDSMSMKSGHTSAKSAAAASINKSSTFGTEYATKKAKGDMKKKGKLDPYAYITLSRNRLNKRKRAKHTGVFRNIVQGARKGALKGVKNRIQKSYKKSKNL